MARRHRPFTYPPVGRCIYCGRSNVKLTKEHILAEALGGGLILPKASCLDCAKCTCRAESHCLNKTLKAARTLLRFPSKRPLPTKLKLKTIKAGIETTAEVPIEDYPTAIILPTFNIPQLLVEAFPDELSDVDRNRPPWTCAHKSIQKAAPSPTTTLLLAEGSFVSFARMFAKMAHAYAVAERGIDAFEPMLTDLIREQTEDFDNVIGTDPDFPDPIASKARIGLRDRDVGSARFVIASIQIFCRFGAPLYHVIVGKLIDSDKR